MKSFIINAARGVASQKKKYDVTSKLIGREWRMLTDDQSITGKYIFLKDGKLLMSVNGLSTYSTWQMATESTLIMDEGVASFLYKVVHIDENLVVLNLDGTDNYCFLINDGSLSLANATLEDIQWYLYRNSHIDILTEGQKKIVEEQQIQKELKERVELERKQAENEEEMGEKACFLAIIIVFFLILFEILNKR